MSQTNVKIGGGSCPFAVQQNGGGGAADHVISVVGGINDQKANPDFGNLIATRGGGRSRSSRRSALSKSRMSKLNSLLKRLKSLNSRARGGGKRTRRGKSRKNYSRRNKH